MKDLVKLERFYKSLKDISIINSDLDNKRDELKEEVYAFNKSIQERKMSLMEELGNLWSSYLEASSSSSENLPVKKEFQSKLVDCRDKHIRNDLLLKKQLEITKNLIQVITNRSNDQVNIYNRLGRIS